MYSDIYNAAPINSIDSLLINTLRVSDVELAQLLNTSYEKRYHYPVKKAYKKDGTIRRIMCPSQLTRKFQRRVNNSIFKKNIIWPEFLFGSIPNSDDSNIENKDYIKCAGKHCGAKSLLKIDVSDFFDNIHRVHVHSVFKNCFGFKEEVAAVLCDICCFEDNLVQGALTSSYISNLIFFDLESSLVKRLERKKLIYTRFVDDITISSKVSNYNFTNARVLVEEMLLAKDLPINSSKTGVMYSSMEPLVVHGLRVEFEQPRLPSKEIANIKSAIHQLSKLSSEKKYRKSRGYRREYNRCMGRVNKLKRIGHNKHAEFIEKLHKIPPLPSAVDIKSAFITIERLKKDFTIKSNTHWYRKRYFRLAYLNRLIKILYPRESKLISLELNNLNPDIVAPLDK